jgi:hypothetical protein
MNETKNIIFLLNDNYDYVSRETKPNYMVTINSSLYITGFNNV